MDGRRNTSGFESLLSSHGKNFDDLKSSKVIKASQMEKLEQGDYGAVRLSTIGAIMRVLDCSALEVLNAFSSKRNR